MNAQQLDRVRQAMDRLNADRDEIVKRRANGSHTIIEGSTHESKFSNSQNSTMPVPEFGKKF